jgi:hypothetical protein
MSIRRVLAIGSLPAGLALILGLLHNWPWITAEEWARGVAADRAPEWVATAWAAVSWMRPAEACAGAWLAVAGLRLTKRTPGTRVPRWTARAWLMGLIGGAIGSGIYLLGDRVIRFGLGGHAAGQLAMGVEWAVIGIAILSLAVFVVAGIPSLLCCQFLPLPMIWRRTAVKVMAIALAIGLSALAGWGVVLLYDHLGLGAEGPGLAYLVLAAYFTWGSAIALEMWARRRA